MDMTAPDAASQGSGMCKMMGGKGCDMMKKAAATGQVPACAR